MAESAGARSGDIAARGPVGAGPVDAAPVEAALERFALARVMVVDDNEANLAVLRELLVRAGLRDVRTFADPRLALGVLEEMRPDLVLVDLHMPHVDGYAVLAHVTRVAAGTYLPALVLTADTSRDAIGRALRAGARDFLTKPFDATEVILRVRNLLDARFLHRELQVHNRWLRAQVRGARQERGESEERQVQRERIAAVLRNAALRMVFQPVVDLSTGVVVGVEALARFPGAPTRGPDVWFAEAERVGLGIDLEILAVRTALESLAELPAPAFLAVNVSPATMLSPELRAACPRDAWPRLVLELTEHVLIEDYHALNAAITALRAGGARIAVDDAGAGYAGFRHLLALKPDIVKTDLSLTQGIDADPARRALLSALVRFTRETGAELIAEGVETGAELVAIQELATPWAQGYRLGVPQPLADALVLDGDAAAALTRARADRDAPDPCLREFVALAARELQAPVAAIGASAEALAERWDSLGDPRRRSAVASINLAAGNLGRFVEDLLMSARLAEGSLDARPVPVPLAAALRRYLADHPEYGRVSLACPDDLVARVDPRHLDHMLDQYLCNAFMHGAPPIRVEAAARAGWVEVRVYDAGGGVPAEAQLRLFSWFGEGLKLWIVRGLAEANGGQAAYDGAGGGACFVIRLPA